MIHCLRRSATASPVGCWGPSGRSASAPGRSPLRRDPVHAREAGLPWCLEFGTFLYCCVATAGGWPPAVCTAVSRAPASGMWFSQALLGPGRCRGWPSAMRWPRYAPFLGGGIASVASWRADFVLLNRLGAHLGARLPGPERAKPCRPLTSRATTLSSGSWLGAAVDYGRLLRDRPPSCLPAHDRECSHLACGGLRAASPF